LSVLQAASFVRELHSILFNIYMNFFKNKII